MSGGPPAAASSTSAILRKFGALVRRPAEAIHLRILRGANFTDLVQAHLAVLRYPGPEGRRPSDLATEVGATRQAMNCLLGRLERVGYLERRADPDDQRSRRVHLTPRGRALQRVVRRTVSQIEAELETELGTESYAQLRTVLVRLNDTDTVTVEDADA